MPTKSPSTAQYATVLLRAFKAHLETLPSREGTFSLVSLSGFANEAFAAAGLPELPPMLVRQSVLALLCERGAVELLSTRKFRIPPTKQRRAVQLAHLLNPKVLSEVLGEATPEQRKTIIDRLTQASQYVS